MSLKDSDRKQADEQGYPVESGVKNLEPASQCTRQCEYVNTSPTDYVYALKMQKGINFPACTICYIKSKKNAT